MLQGSKSCDAYTKNGSANALGVKDQTVYEPKVSQMNILDTWVSVIFVQSLCLYEWR